MRPIADALNDVMARVAPLGSQHVSLQESFGRFASRAVHARRDEPAFHNSAMDGYAVRFADVARSGEPPSLEVRGESRAGGGMPDGLVPGTTMRIFTGAPLPEGADTVIMQENVDREGDRATFREIGAEGSNVRRRGGVVETGNVVLEAGAGLRSGEIGLLASQGVAVMEVHRRPSVAILSTGDELRVLGEPAPPGTLYDSNAHALAAAVRDAGGEPTVLPHRRDEASALAAEIGAALRSFDVLITTGGVSVGDYDLVHGAFADNEVTEVFYKVRMKPGKPVRFGITDRALAFGLPGNPVSAWVTFEVFVRPALRRMLGDPRPFRATREVLLTHAIRGAKGRVELARARLEAADTGPARATVHRARGSAAMTSLVDVDALLIVPEGSELVEGSAVRAVDLRSTKGAAEHRFDV